MEGVFSSGITVIAGPAGTSFCLYITYVAVAHGAEKLVGLVGSRLEGVDTAGFTLMRHVNTALE